MEEKGMNCPNGHGKMVIRRVKKKMTFRGVNIAVPTNQYVCKVCGIEAGTVQQVADIQKAILEAYRKKHGTLSRYPLKPSLQ
jgi:hypothetical protein